MHENMNRVESAVTATSCGNLTWEQWPHDYATALGFAGQRNPLGFAVVRYLSDGESAAEAWNIILLLSTVLVMNGYEAAKAKDAAWAAVDAWSHLRCGQCGGRGQIYSDNAVVMQCPSCAGTGEPDKENLTDIVRDGIGALMEAERWMEGQLAARLKR